MYVVLFEDIIELILLTKSDNEARSTAQRWEGELRFMKWCVVGIAELLLMRSLQISFLIGNVLRYI